MLSAKSTIHPYLYLRILPKTVSTRAFSPCWLTKVYNKTEHPHKAVRHPTAMGFGNFLRSSMKSTHRSIFVLFLAATALAQQAPVSSTPAAPASKPATTPAPRKVDRAASYYHYTVAHMYEDEFAVYNRSDLATKAIEEYRQAIDADPTSEYLTSGLAELYAKTGRIRDAVLEAQDILKKDPNNLEAHKLLGRIYLRSLGDVQSGSGSDSVLKLAIEQYQEIIKIEPDNVDDHLLLGRLYRLNNDLRKAEDEFKTAVKLQPDSEEAVTTLAYLYNEEGDSARAAEALSAVPDAPGPA